MSLKYRFQIRSSYRNEACVLYSKSHTKIFHTCQLHHALCKSCLCLKEPSILWPGLSRNPWAASCYYLLCSSFEESRTMVSVFGIATDALWPEQLVVSSYFLMDHSLDPLMETIRPLVKFFTWLAQSSQSSRNGLDPFASIRKRMYH